MKIWLKRFFKRNKKILIAMGITLILFMVVSMLAMSMFVSNHVEINEFLQGDRDMGGDLFPVSMFSILFVLLGIVFFCLFTIFVIKIFFPNSKAFSNLFMQQERSLLRDLPRALKKEVIRDE